MNQIVMLKKDLSGGALGMKKGLRGIVEGRDMSGKIIITFENGFSWKYREFPEDEVEMINEEEAQ